MKTNVPDEPALHVFDRQVNKGEKLSPNTSWASNHVVRFFIAEDVYAPDRTRNHKTHM